MVSCDYCKKDLSRHGGCTLSVFKGTALNDGITRSRIRFKAQRNQRFCKDCNVPNNSFHHPGCDMERCPSCWNQAITCNCTTTTAWETRLDFAAGF